MSIESLRHQIDDHAGVLEMLEHLEQSFLASKPWMLQVNRWDGVRQFRFVPSENTEMGLAAVALARAMREVYGVYYDKKQDAERKIYLLENPVVEIADTVVFEADEPVEGPAEEVCVDLEAEVEKAMTTEAKTDVLEAEDDAVTPDDGDDVLEAEDDVATPDDEDDVLETEDDAVDSGDGGNALKAEDDVVASSDDGGLVLEDEGLEAKPVVEPQAVGGPEMEVASTPVDEAEIDPSV